VEYKLTLIAKRSQFKASKCIPAVFSQLTHQTLFN